MQNLFKGGVGKVEFDTVETFDSQVGTPNFPLVTLTEFTKSGNTWPEPEPLKDAIHDDQEIIAAWDVPFAFGALNVTVADADAISDLGEAGTRIFARFTSKDEKTVVVLKNVIPHAWPVGITERGTHGYVRFEGKSGGVARSDAYSHTFTP